MMHRDGAKLAKLVEAFFSGAARRGQSVDELWPVLARIWLSNDLVDQAGVGVAVRLSQRALSSLPSTTK